MFLKVWRIDDIQNWCLYGNFFLQCVKLLIQVLDLWGAAAENNIFQACFGAWDADKMCILHFKDEKDF